MGWTAAARRIVSGPTSEETDVANVSGLDHVGNGAHRLFDGHVRIKAGSAR